MHTIYLFFNLKTRIYFLSTEGLVYIQWDSGIRSQYGYGYKGIYDVVVCEEPRYPEDGLAAVGCFVRRGKWSFFYGNDTRKH